MTGLFAVRLTLREAVLVRAWSIQRSRLPARPLTGGEGRAQLRSLIGSMQKRSTEDWPLRTRRHAPATRVYHSRTRWRIRSIHWEKEREKLWQYKSGHSCLYRSVGQRHKGERVAWTHSEDAGGRHKAQCHLDIPADWQMLQGTAFIFRGSGELEAVLNRLDSAEVGYSPALVWHNRTGWRPREVVLELIHNGSIQFEGPRWELRYYASLWNIYWDRFIYIYIIVGYTYPFP